MFKYRRNSTDCANLVGARNHLRRPTFLCLLIKISVAFIDNLEFIYSLKQDSQVNWFMPLSGLTENNYTLFVCLFVCLLKTSSRSGRGYQNSDRIIRSPDERKEQKQTLEFSGKNSDCQLFSLTSHWVATYWDNLVITKTIKPAHGAQGVYLLSTASSFPFMW